MSGSGASQSRRGACCRGGTSRGKRCGADGRGGGGTDFARVTVRLRCGAGCGSALRLRNSFCEGDRLRAVQCGPIGAAAVTWAAGRAGLLCGAGCGGARDGQGYSALRLRRGLRRGAGRAEDCGTGGAAGADARETGDAEAREGSIRSSVRYFGVKQRRNWLSRRVRKAFASCCGVNLAGGRRSWMGHLARLAGLDEPSGEIGRRGAHGSLAVWDRSAPSLRDSPVHQRASLWRQRGPESGTQGMRPRDQGCDFRAENGGWPARIPQR
jgi:hypothetical protein